MSNIIGTFNFEDIYAVTKGAYKSDKKVKWLKPNVKQIQFGTCTIIPKRDRYSSISLSDCLYTCEDLDTFTKITVYSSPNIDFIKNLNELENFSIAGTEFIFKDLDIKVSEEYFVFNEHNEYEIVQEKIKTSLRCLVKDRDSYIPTKEEREADEFIKELEL